MSHLTLHSVHAICAGNVAPLIVLALLHLCAIRTPQGPRKARERKAYQHHRDKGAGHGLLQSHDMAAPPRTSLDTHNAHRTPSAGVITCTRSV